MCVHSSERVKQIKTVDVDNTALLKLIIIFLKLWYTIIKNMEKTGIFFKGNNILLYLPASCTV